MSLTHGELHFVHQPFVLVLFPGLSPPSLQAVLCVPDRHAVQESRNPVLGVWVSKAAC